MKYYTTNPAYHDSIISEERMAKILKKINRYKDPEDILTAEEYIKYAELHEMTAREAFDLYESRTTLDDSVAIALIHLAGLEIPSPAGDTLDEMNLCEKAVEVLGFREPRYIPREF